MSGISSLPDELLVSIMRLLPLPTRTGLGSVSSQFNAAAAAATNAIACVVGTQEPDTDIEPETLTTTSISSWLDAHGDHLTSLKLIHGWGWQLHQLPCQNLVELELDGLNMQFEPDANFPGVLQCSTALTKLVLAECAPVQTDSNPLGQIAELTSLQHLELQDLWYRYKQGPDGIQHVLPGFVLQQLQHLTHLTVECDNSITDESLQHISCLTRLQEVKLMSRTAAAALQDLPEDVYLPVQRMEVCGQDSWGWHVSTAPGIKSLTSLTYLKVQDCALHPAALFELTQLQHLHLQKVSEIYDAHSPPSRMLELLAALQQLQVLLLYNVATSWPTSPTPAQLTPYSVLTASTSLQRLGISRCETFPVAALQHMFGEGKRLPQLHALTLQWPCQHFAPPGAPQQPVSALDSAEVALIASSCPALRELRVSAKPGTDFAPLRQCELTLLRTSTHSNDPNTPVRDGSTVRSVSALTRLQQLELPGLCGGAFDDVLQLTALTSLTKLSCKVQEQTAGVVDVIKLQLKPQADGTGVSQQLRTRHDNYKLRQEELNQAWHDHLRLHQQQLPPADGQQHVQQAPVLTPAQQQQQLLLQQFWEQHWQQQQQDFGVGLHLAQPFGAQAFGPPVLLPPQWQGAVPVDPQAQLLPPGGVVMLPQGMPGPAQLVQLPDGQVVWQLPDGQQLPPQAALVPAQGPPGLAQQVQLPDGQLMLPQLPPDGAVDLAQGAAGPVQDMQPPGAQLGALQLQPAPIDDPALVEDAALPGEDAQQL